MNKAHGKQVLSDCQGETWKIGLKLQSIGAVLERQGEGCEGFRELAGIGYILSELSEQVREVSAKLDHLSVDRQEK